MELWPFAGALLQDRFNCHQKALGQFTQKAEYICHATGLCTNTMRLERRKFGMSCRVWGEIAQIKQKSWNKMAWRCGAVAYQRWDGPLVVTDVWCKSGEIKLAKRLPSCADSSFIKLSAPTDAFFYRWSDASRTSTNWYKVVMSSMVAW